MHATHMFARAFLSVYLSGIISLYITLTLPIHTRCYTFRPVAWAHAWATSTEHSAWGASQGGPWCTHGGPESWVGL